MKKEFTLLAALVFAYEEEFGGSVITNEEAEKIREKYVLESTGLTVEQARALPSAEIDALEAGFEQDIKQIIEETILELKLKVLGWNAQ